METKNKYFLLRHGQTIYQKENRDLIYLDTENFSLEITEDGKKMIEKQVKILEEKNIDLIFSSPYLRTKQSAQIASKILGKEIIFDERLVDIKMGEFEGKPTSVYDDFFISKKLGFTQHQKDGENWADVLKRMKEFFNDVEDKYQNKNILIVSHGEPLWLLAGFLKGFKTLDEFLSTRKTKNNLYPEVGDLIII
jgi:isoleucyl-tRNA synthetase